MPYCSSLQPVIFYSFREIKSIFFGSLLQLRDRWLNFNIFLFHTGKRLLIIMVEKYVRKYKVHYFHYFHYFHNYVHYFYRNVLLGSRDSFGRHWKQVKSLFLKQITISDTLCVLYWWRVFCVCFSDMCLLTNCLSVFDHFVKLALKGFIHDHLHDFFFPLLLTA